VIHRVGEFIELIGVPLKHNAFDDLASSAAGEHLPGDLKKDIRPTASPPSYGATKGKRAKGGEAHIRSASRVIFPRAWLA